MLPHDERRFEHISAKLAEMATLETKAIDKIFFAECEGYATHGEIPHSFKKYTSSVWGGRADAHAWFQFHVNYPQIKEGQEVLLQISTGIDGWDACNPQMLLFYDGLSVRGMDMNHTKFLLPKGVKEVVAYAYTGTNVTKPITFEARLIVRDKRIHALQSKMAATCDILKYTPLETGLRTDISETLKEAVLALDFTQLYSQTFYASIEKADAILSQKMVDGGEKPTVWAVGHTHIDIAWLWTKAQTKEKVLRSFGTALALMDEYPEYRFISSQPILYEYVKEQDPAMYARIKEKIASGQWEVEGAMWVEADCNLSSGESLIRQILVGKQFIKEEFGKDSKVLWLPDVFGYSANLPQILEKSGVEKFVTSKISWNEFNRMPHEIFHWQGIDGTKTLAFFLTTQQKVQDEKSVNYVTYNGAGTPAEVEGTWYRFSDKNLTKDVLMPYGYGDGGGGTTPEMIERMKVLQTGVKGCAKTKLATVTEFFEKLDRNLEGKTLPQWMGELYLEFHRGTYTSMAKNKKNNRMAEFALWRSEWASEMALLLTDKPYPKTEINACLKSVLTNQFHDILPGSSIQQVYDETDKDYAEVFSTLGTVETSAYQRVADNLQENGVVIFNPNSFEGKGTVVLDGVTMGVENVPSKGYALTKEFLTSNHIQATERSLENAFFTLKINENGEIVSLIDKRVNREIVAKQGLLNKIVAYEDLPFEYDNWEIKDYYQEKPITLNKAEHIRIVTDGIRKGLAITRKYFSSSIEQTVWLYENLDRIDFETKVDWQEKHTLLRAEFETDVLADSATYEIQYGSVKRPSNDNTSWEHAKFETCAHKYVDVSEFGYGVALLNDCKYGHSVRGGKIGLTLLKCGTYPNPDADQGEHLFTYSLMPHTGDYRTAGVIEQAYLLNNPLIVVNGKGKGNLPTRWSMIAVDKNNIVIEVVKQSEDGKGMVVRAYESAGGQTRANFTLGFNAKAVYECNLMEENPSEIAYNGNKIACTFSPFEIKTLHITK
ncbi:MAG: alpha-mannosidase [Clostridiales bacterium]|nr:alpha-mannosidase [Clostridiales bacterium]